MKAACLKKEGLTVRLGELLYYVFFAGLLFAKGIGLYDGQKSFKIILIVSCVCWAGKMLMTGVERRELLTAVLLLLLGAVVYRVSGDKGFLLYVMMVTGAKDVPLKRIFTVGLITWVLSFGGMFFLTASHIVSSPFKVHEKGGELIVRWGLGSPHPNVLHVSYLVFCMFTGFCLDKRISLKWLIAMMAGNFYVFLYSVSFTGFIAVSFYLALCGYWMLRKKIEAVDKTLLYGGAAFCVLFSMAGPVLIRGKALQLFHQLSVFAFWNETVGYCHLQRNHGLLLCICLCGLRHSRVFASHGGICVYHTQIRRRAEGKGDVHDPGGHGCGSDRAVFVQYLI